MKVERLLEEIRARLDIVDIISDYLELRRSGQNYKGLCPFHSEKTPSFMVSPGKQIFHCFGCGAGGNSITFIMKYENLSFPEALKHLAKKAGISLKDFAFDNGHDNMKERLHGAIGEVSKIFAENLRKSSVAHSYLIGRGITDETIRRFSLGYALKDWHFLSKALRHKGIADALILQSGAVSSGEKGIFDTFRDRIIFSICDVQGNIIAFGGRVMDDSQPKYLNSPDTPLFKKGETLYGLNLAKDGLREKGYAIIVEGYFDAILCHQHGFNNAVAPLGTALTSGHLQKLKRFSKEAVLVFDGDEAGKSAAKRSIPLLLAQGFTAKILLLPEKDDPDSFLRNEGPEAFGKLLSKARSVVDFLLDASKKDRTAAVHETLEIISATGDPIMKEALIAETAKRTGFRETIIREKMKGIDKRPKGKGSVEKSSPDGPLRSLKYDEEVLLLSAVIACPDKLERILEKVPLEEFGNGRVKNIFEKLAAQGGCDRLDSIITSLGEEEKRLVTTLTVAPGFDPEAVDRNIEDCMKKIAMRKERERLKAVHERIREAEGSGEHELLDSLLPERQKLIKEAR